MLQIGVIEIVGTNDPTPFVQQMNMMGMLAEEDFSIELANHDRRSLSMSAPDDTYFGQQWALDDMRVHQILNDRLSDNNTSCDQDDHPMIPVALIDSGVDYGHPDVADAIYENEAEDGMMAQYLVDDDSNGFIDDVRGWNFIDENANVMDNNGHGTACAGLIAAEGFNGEGIIGVGYPFARVLPLKVFDYDVTGRLSDALRAFDYAIDKGVKISSVSWFARSYSAVFHIAVGRAGTFGHLLVAAAGNDGQDLDVMGGSYPCGFNATNVLCTAAHTASGDRWISSNYGPIVVDVSAPGVNVISTATPNGYATFNGTSLAAAEVAGLAALLIGARSPFPLAFDEVIAAIISTASVSGWTAYGRVDAYAALQAVVGNANWLNGALTVWKDDECVEYVRLSPFSSVEMQLCVFTPPMIGYREYDLGGVIGEGAVHLDIRLRAVPPPGACQVSVPMIDFGVLMAGSTGIASYTITNTFGSDLVVDPSRILPTTPEVQVILPAGPVVVAEGQSVIVELSLAVFHPGPVNLVVDSLSENCPPIPLTASVQSSTIRVSNGSATNSTEYIPVGLRMVPSTATIENPSTYELKTQVVASDAEYLVEGPFSAVSFPIWPTGGGWVPEISIVGQHILSGCIGGEVHMISLGQYFPFFGVDVDSVNVGCNGFIELPPLSPSPVTALPRIPSPAEPKHAIAAYWTEANSTRCSVSSCNISYVLDYKTRLLVVEWDGLEVRVNNSWHTLSMQVHLFSEGRIDLLYASLPDPAYREDVAAGLKGSDANDCPNLMHLLATSGPLTLIFIPKVKSQQVIVPPLSSMSVNFSLAVPYMGVPDDDLDAWCEDDINWLDGAGRHCADYVAEALCTPAGLYGIGWNALWGDFMTVATTTPANVSCCGCGGGTWYRDDSPGADWQDIVKLELKYSNSSQGKFDRTVKGSQSLDLILTGIEPVVSTAGGNRILRVVALDSSGVINNKETGLIVTVEEPATCDSKHA
ncbi:subtilisin, putative [Perkinsus marinus ATCC 50983]|uniref:subtilisin n=1 Tax=Perkinsus marinus (strain ATCC 50983 / TXsc) TaxID=423536 RepID=C5KM02_PERM5|nr:subtilisin, putative [Perkinsus marinus ATCC 50983]EER14517.1 subtilisin, putative [Perkinsus marinus ATCC 50983]|eukprot:XP_002782722.1 subtilisin, putative [Perkinsus marinus ATCC 50983]